MKTDAMKFFKKKRGGLRDKIKETIDVIIILKKREKT